MVRGGWWRSCWSGVLLVGLPWIAAAAFLFAEMALIFAISSHDDFAQLRRRCAVPSHV